MTKNLQNLTLVVKNIFLFMLTVDERKLLNTVKFYNVITVILFKESVSPYREGKIANFGRKML